MCKDKAIFPPNSGDTARPQGHGQQSSPLPHGCRAPPSAGLPSFCTPSKTPAPSKSLRCVGGEQTIFCPEITFKGHSCNAQEVKQGPVPPAQALLQSNSKTREGGGSTLQSSNTIAGKGLGAQRGPAARPGLTLVGAQAEGKDQHPATPFALHAVPQTALGGWFLSCAAPRLRNLGWVGSSENPHLRRAITTPLSLRLDYKIITSLRVEGGTRGRQVFPGSRGLATPGCDGERCPTATAIFCAPHQSITPHKKRAAVQVLKTNKFRTSQRCI